MSFSIVFHQEARRDFLEAFEWYEAQRTGLGLEFMALFEDCLRKICEHPHYYSTIHKSYRQSSVGKFPYLIVFEIVAENDVILISAIHHTSRSPGRKFRKSR